MYRAGGSEPKVAAVTRIQLLATSLVERVHDAVYVIPRHVAQAESSLNLDEYAIDIAYAVTELLKESDNLPPRRTHEEVISALKRLKEQDAELTDQIRVKLGEAEELSALAHSKVEAI